MFLNPTYFHLLIQQIDLSPLETDYTQGGMPFIRGIYDVVESTRRVGGDVDSNLLSATCHLSEPWQISSSPWTSFPTSVKRGVLIPTSPGFVKICLNTQITLKYMWNSIPEKAWTGLVSRCSIMFQKMNSFAYSPSFPIVSPWSWRPTEWMATWDWGLPVAQSGITDPPGSLWRTSPEAVVWAHATSKIPSALLLPEWSSGYKFG